MPIKKNLHRLGVVINILQQPFKGHPCISKKIRFITQFVLLQAASWWRILGLAELRKDQFTLTDCQREWRIEKDDLDHQ